MVSSTLIVTLNGVEHLKLFARIGLSAAIIAGMIVPATVAHAEPSRWIYVGDYGTLDRCESAGRRLYEGKRPWHCNLERSDWALYYRQ